MIRVVIADDSAFTRRVLRSYLDEVPDIQVVAEAGDPEAAVRAVGETRPDVVTLDLRMKGGDGLETLRRILAVAPVSALVISGVTAHTSAAATLRALELGAFDVILKYTPGVATNPETLRREVVAKVRAAAAARVARAASGARLQAAPAARTRVDRPRLSSAVPPGEAPVPAWCLGYRRTGVVVIGASTGGPSAVEELLAQLPADFSRPIVLVQHMPASLMPEFASVLDSRVALSVVQAAPGDCLQAGRVLVAPGAFHLVVKPANRVDLRPAAPDDPYNPWIDVTMTSGAAVYGREITGVVLTGMGDDGASGLAAIRAGGGYGCVQDSASCTIDGMPLRAFERGGADLVADPAEIGRALANRN